MQEDPDPGDMDPGDMDPGDMDPGDPVNDRQDLAAVEVQELRIQGYQLISRSGTSALGAGRVRASPRIEISGVPSHPGGVLRAANIYFRRLDEGIFAPLFEPNVRTPYVSMYVWLDHMPMILAQLALPDRRLLFRRFADGNLRAELLARPA